LAADDEVGGAVGDGLGGCGDAFLVAGILAWGADAGGDEDFLRTSEGADGAGFEGRADKAVDTGGEPQADALADEVADSGFAGVAETGEIFFAEAGEDGDAEELEGGGRFAGDGGSHDLRVSVEGEEVDAEVGGAADGATDGFGDVVEFEIEKNFFALG
jgi:hypothetical protein